MNVKTSTGYARFFCLTVALILGTAVMSCKMNVDTTAEKFTVSFSVNGEHGVLTAKTADGTNINTGNSVTYGKTVIFTAEPHAGYMVSSWAGITPPTPNAERVTHKVTDSITITVAFKPIPPVLYTVTMEHGEHGAISANPSLAEDNKVARNTEIEFSASPDDRYAVDKWEISGGTLLSGGKPGNTTANIKITADTTVKVRFKERTYKVTFGASDGHGTITATVLHGSEILTGDNLDYETIVTFTATPHPGYTIGVWTVNGASGNTSQNYKHTIKENLDVQMSFTPIPNDQSFTVDGVTFKMKGISAVTNGLVGANKQSDNKLHSVSLTAYFIGETEVTQELWEKVMDKNPSFFDNSGNKPVPRTSLTVDTNIANGEEQIKRPVDTINWYHAIAFCNKLSLKLEREPCYTVLVAGNPVNFDTLSFDAIPARNNDDWNKVALDMSKNGFRLPTDAEWEWAAKGGSDNKWAGTNEKVELKNYAWYKNEKGGNADGKTHQVAKKQPNGYGLYDIGGNVSEWCWDLYDTRSPRGGQTDPTGFDVHSIERSDTRNWRGGSFMSHPDIIAHAHRNPQAARYTDHLFGMRLVCR